jgi:hypothetical protein
VRHIRHGFFQRGIGSQFGAWLGGHFASPVALNAAIVLLSIASTMVFLVPAARDKLTKAQAKVEHKRLTLEIEPRQRVLPGRRAENFRRRV